MGQQLGPGRQCARSEAVVRCSRCESPVCYGCARNDYTTGGVVCLHPCRIGEHSSVSGSSSSEPLTQGRAISQSPCASYAGLRARRNGGERVRRRITVIESDDDMQIRDMPDEAIRALHEKRRLCDQESEERYLHQDHQVETRREGTPHASTTSANGHDLD